MLRPLGKTQCYLGFILLTQAVSPAFVNAQEQLQIRGIVQTIDGKPFVRPDESSLKDISRYRKQFESQISKFPELKDAGIEELKIPPSFNPVLATVDNYWGSSEQTDSSIPTSRYVSGSVSCSGKNKTVAPSPGQAISYLELTNGQRWISGKQLVDGGCGILKSINNGKEPAGRLVWGTDALKIVLTGVDETNEIATFSAYLRVCANLPLGRTCTPYFIPIPWFSVQGQNWIAIGRGLV